MTSFQRTAGLSAILFAALTASGQTASGTNADAAGTLPFTERAVDSYSNNTDPVTHQPRILHWGDLKAYDFGPRAIDWQGHDLSPLSPPPPPGIHPRILFTPADIPKINRRWHETTAGRIVYGHLLAYSAALRGRYDEHAAYAQPDIWKGNYRGSHGNTNVLYYHDHDSPFNPENHIFDRLRSGDTSIDPAPLWTAFAYDALRCLIEGDSQGAHELAAAVTTAMHHDQSAREADRKAHPSAYPPKGPVSGGAGGQEFGYLYDFLCPYLTPQQKQEWHDELAATTGSHDNYGTFNAAVSTRSNWATFTYWLIPLLAIEGEPGYNELKAEGIYRGYRNFLTYGIFRDGAYVEGEAKDQLGGDGLVAMAMRRRPDLSMHPYLQAYVHQFLPQSIVPNTQYVDTDSVFAKGPFLRYDLLGGIGVINMADALTLKYRMPNDRIVDWIYRNQVGDHYERLPNGSRQPGYWDDLLLAAIFATDFDSSNADPAKLGLPTTYFSGERALMLTRSDWTPEALEIGLHVRESNGGHPFADRNSIFVFGAGRAWGITSQRSGDNTQQSEVVIDAHPQGANAPGRMVDFVDRPLATFAVGDASYAWDWDLTTMNYNDGYTATELRDGKVKEPAGHEPEMHSIDDFGYVPIGDPYAEAPLFHLHSWIAQDGIYTPVVRQSNYPVVKAFRTAGLVRGPRPYALVIDDIQKDEAVHHYAWQLLVESDEKIVAQGADPAEQGVWDITLATSPKAKPGDPELLIRVLDCDTAQPLTNAQIVSPANPKTEKPVLRLSVNAVSPRFKVLLYPLHAGDALPSTHWNQAHTQVSVNLPGQDDTIQFASAPTGKTDVRVVRGGASLIDVNAPVKPLPDPAPLSETLHLP